MHKRAFVKGILIASLSVFTFQTPQTDAGIPVVDVPTLVQSAITALENVDQTLQLVQQFQTQILQFENQLRNTVNPDVWIWNRAQQTMADIRGIVNTIDHYKNTYNGLEGYLRHFQDQAFYQNNACFTGGCTDAQRQTLLDSRALASASMKRANDALFRGLDYQQQALSSDANQLERLQNAAQTAQGQVQAIQFANQLASNQANQLLHIRTLLVAQHNASATMMQSTVNKKAQEAAAERKLMKSAYKPSQMIAW